MSQPVDATSHRRIPPPLPPRRPPAVVVETADEAPPPYTPYAADVPASHDPRSSSTQSLLPVEDRSKDGRRKLLLVYIHGFMGDETSFQSFPAHVHNLLAITVADTHVVHTKIYPRYRSRESIEFARDDFSRWLAPHEGPDTDVVLLGHSMGGLLAAEVVLLPAQSPDTEYHFRHRILGTINFDTPFLGMHPGVIRSGLSSIFRPADSPAKHEEQGYFPAGQEGSSLSPEPGSSSNTPLASPPSWRDTILSPPVDPNYNPAFPNDIRLPIRKGWDNALHFISKHSDDLFKASRQLVQSHLEFGGAMADFTGLRNRYVRIRALEEEDDRARMSIRQEPLPRVRFVNYYTASTGRVKPPKTPSPPADPTPEPGEEHGKEASAVESGLQDLNLGSTSTDSVSQTENELSHFQSADTSMEDNSDEDEFHEALDGSESITAASIRTSASPEPMALLDPIPLPSSGPPSPDLHPSQPDDPPDLTASTTTLTTTTTETPSTTETTTTLTTLTSSTTIPPPPSSLPDSDPDSSPPPLPSPPTTPPPPETTHLHPSARKLAEKHHSAALKAHKQAQHAYRRAIREREKLLAARAKAQKKTDRQRAKAREQREKAHEKRGLERRATEDAVARAEMDDVRREHPALFLDGEVQSEVKGKQKEKQKKEKEKKDRRFCVLPSGAAEVDRTWVRVFMPGVDEVGAHCGLFFLGPPYERLVGDVAGRVEEWVREGATVGLARRLAAWEEEGVGMGEGMGEGMGDWGLD